MNLTEIKARCEEVGTCWEWQGAYTTSGSPLVYHEGKRTSVRKLVYALKHGRPLPDGQVASNSCQNPRCVCDDHVRGFTQAQMLHRSRANTNQELRAARIAATKRRTVAKLTPEQVQMVRDSPKTNLALAAELGVHHSHLSVIRRGKAWRTFGSPFAGLGAR